MTGRRQDTADDLPAGIGEPAARAFANAGLVRLEQFTEVRAADLRRLHGVGPKAIETIRRALEAQGRSFAE
jgi:predicted flap endonuclease-1-like 5' DNA nuclease